MSPFLVKFRIAEHSDIQILLFRVRAVGPILMIPRVARRGEYAGVNLNWEDYMSDVAANRPRRRLAEDRQ